MIRLHLLRAAVLPAVLAAVSLTAGAARVPAAADRPPTPDVPLSAYRALVLGQHADYLAAPTTLRLEDVRPEDVAPSVATVTFSRDVDAQQALALIEAIGARVSNTIPDMNVYQATLPRGWTVADGIAALSDLPGALRAEPVTRQRLALRPNDPLYGQYQQYLPVINAEQAWDIQQGDPKIVVAVLDSGLDINHPDIKGQVWTNPNAGHTGCGNDVHGCNFVDPNLTDPVCLISNPNAAPNPDTSASHWHETFVAGIIGAATNNGEGIAGIVPHATIMPVRVADCFGELWAPAVASAVNYAVNNGALVINLSSGGSECSSLPSYALEAINQAILHGVTVVASAGNDGLGCVASPANLPGVIAVSAISSIYDQRAFFSNWGPQIAVAAPGWAIMSTTPGRDGQPPFNYYRISQGTSFSAPIVAGLADLLLSQNPLLTPAQVRSLIQRGATKLSGGEANWAGSGRVDLAASLRLTPAALYGTVAVNGAPAPDGAVVEARVGSAVCGQAFTSMKNGQAIYALFVAADAEQAGCGKPGARLTLTVNGVPSGMADWKAAAIALDLGGPATASAAGRLFPSGWNLVAGPAGTVFAGSEGGLYTLQPDAEGYTALPSGAPTKTGFGYWAYFSRDTAVSFAADGPQSYSVAVPAGRYVMVGDPSGTKPATVSGGDSVLTFDPRKNAYVESHTLQPGQGALVLSLAGATVSVSAAGP